LPLATFVSDCSEFRSTVRDQADGDVLRKSAAATDCAATVVQRSLSLKGSTNAMKRLEQLSEMHIAR